MTCTRCGQLRWYRDADGVCFVCRWREHFEKKS